MSIGSKPSGAGKNLSGSSGNTGPSDKKNPCAKAGAACTPASGNTKVGSTGKQGPQNNLSGSRGGG